MEPMTLSDNGLEALLAEYNEAIDLLKSKMLSGESWENLRQQRGRITRLAAAIQAHHTGQTVGAEA